MSFAQHRARLYETLPENTIVICHAGVPIHTNEDHYGHPFEVNSQFFYLTGLERENMVFLALKAGGETRETLLIRRIRTRRDGREKWRRRRRLPPSAEFSRSG